MPTSKSNSLNKKPHVTVGIPVYNEEKNIASTLDSVLSQKYQNFEIIVSDNNSLDNTLKIVQEYSKNNQKITIIQNKKNQGSLENFNNLIKNAKGEYFVIAGAHDLWSENYLTELIEELDNNPKAVIAYGKTIWIDEKNEEINQTGFTDTSDFNILQKYNLVFWGNQHALYGIIRLEVIKKTRLQKQIIGSGAVLLNELSLFGDFIVNTNAIWYRRITRAKESREQKLDRYYKSLFKKKKIWIFPYWKFFITYLSVPFIKSNLSFTKKIVLLIITFFNFIFRYYASLFIYDPLSLLKRLFRLKLK